MAEYADREHYIPLRKTDLVTLLCRDGQLSDDEREQVRQFCTLASAVLHFEYESWLDELKDAYASFDPDSETKPLEPPGATERVAAQDKLFSAFSDLMERANFRKLTDEEVREAIRVHAGARGLQTEVDLSVFERLEAFVRGDAVGTEERRPWQKFWFLQREQVPLFHRVVLIVKFRPHSRLPKDVRTDMVYLKIFKDIPKASLGMYHPGARPRLSRIDQTIIVYPLVFGLGLMLFNIVGDMYMGSFNHQATILSWSLALAIGGYGYKSYHSYMVKTQAYHLRMTRTLYYQTLDSNTGVLMHVLDEAEEQECRETDLAYFCLWKYAPDDGWTAGQLDDFVEGYLEQRANLKVDFEIGDALAKLERYGLVGRSGDRFRAVSIDKALEALDYKWDNYFKFNNPAYETPPVA